MRDTFEIKTKWIDCDCNEMSHALRVHYWEEYINGCKEPITEFNIAFKPYDYPGLDTSSVTYCGNDRWYVTRLKKLKFWWLRKAFYLKNVWWALKGRPNWWYADFSGSRKSAMEIVNFLQECFKEEDNGQDKPNQG